MDEAAATAIFEHFLSEKEKSIHQPLAIVAKETQRIPKGWAFVYQSKSYVETGNFSDMLVGQGPVIVLDDGRILEGGSLHPHPEDVLRQFGEIG
jgi:hypothetical protein